MHRSARALPLACAAALLLPLCAAGQARPAPPRGGGGGEPEVFGETIEVRAVNLEVVVTDGAGRRVSGLKPADFALTVDGKPVPVDYFTEVAEGRAVQGGAEAAPPAAGGLEPGREVGTSYLVFVDDSLSLVRRNRNRMLRGFAEQLARLRPQDRMAIVAFGGRRPVLLSGWSQARAELRRALEQAAERPVRGLGTEAVTREARALAILRQDDGEPPVQPVALSGRGLRPGLPAAEESFDDGAPAGCSAKLRLEARMQGIASGLAASMRSLSGVPGRKVALVVASGWPRLDKDVICGTIGPAIWKPVYEVANQLGYTLYMTMAQEPPPAISAEDQAPPDQFTDNPQVKFSPLQETLFELARQTGGRAWAGNPRGDVLGLIAADTRSYYWLGFTPTWKGDDEVHEVKVRVLRPGLEVRSRRGFKDLSRRSEVGNMVENALLFGQFAGALPLAVELGAIAPGRKDTMRVPLKIRVPFDQVTMVQRGEKFAGELELRVAVLDQVGRRNDLAVVPVRLTAARAPRAGESVIHEIELEVRREKQDVVVALFDPPTGRLLETRQVIAPPAPAAAR
jgi:VWFA-related protein